MQIINPVTSLSYRLTDIPLVKGSNTWRLKIELQNGSFIYSDLQTVYYLLPAEYLVFPNPLRITEQLNVIASDASDRLMVLYNFAGQKIRQYQLHESTETVSLPPLQRGLYFIIIYKDGRKEFRQPVIVH